jgi:hypothetical protein
VEYRQLGRSGLRISAMTLGTMGFGGGGVFAHVGTGDAQDARRQIDLALEAGVNMIDTADIYSMGKTEEIVGQALGSRRDNVILATKAAFRVGCSNFAGWQVMKALGIARAEGLPVFVSQQVYPSLQERSAEYEIVPSALDQGLGLLISSPLAGGLLSSKYRRDQPAPEGSRHATDWDDPPVYDEDKLWDTVDALIEVAEEHGVPDAHLSVLASEEDRSRSPGDRRPVADHARSPKSHGARSTSTQFCPPNPNALDGTHPSACPPPRRTPRKRSFTSSTPLTKCDRSRSEQHPPGFACLINRPDRPGCTLTKPWSAESVLPQDDD